MIGCVVSLITLADSFHDENRPHDSRLRRIQNHGIQLSGG
jgi:hypothetical protein